MNTISGRAAYQARQHRDNTHPYLFPLIQPVVGRQTLWTCFQEFTRPHHKTDRILTDGQLLMVKQPVQGDRVIARARLNQDYDYEQDYNYESTTSTERPCAQNNPRARGVRPLMRRQRIRNGREARAAQTQVGNWIGRLPQLKKTSRVADGQVCPVAAVPMNGSIVPKKNAVIIPIPSPSHPLIYHLPPRHSRRKCRSTSRDRGQRPCR